MDVLSEKEGEGQGDTATEVSQLTCSRRSAGPDYILLFWHMEANIRSF